MFCIHSGACFASTLVHVLHPLWSCFASTLVHVSHSLWCMFSQVMCDGMPVGVVIPGPSLTEGYPATNPSLRLLEFDPDTFELVDMKTYYGDLHAANGAVNSSRRSSLLNGVGDIGSRRGAASGEAMARTVGKMDWQLECVLSCHLTASAPHERCPNTSKAAQIPRRLHNTS
jgi:hypothetical protein